MIKIIGNDIKRDGEKIGWIEGNDVRDMSNRKLAFVKGDDIFRGSDGIKIAFIEGAYVIVSSSGKKISVTENNQAHVTGGSASNEMRAAIRLFFGD
jgi:hypothetical protein